MKNLGAMMKQAQQMQAKMGEMQEKLADMAIDGSSGAGMVRVTLDGKFALKNIKIDPSLLGDADEAEVLEDLIVAAFNDAKVQVEQAIQEQMSEMTGGLDLPPGFKLPF